MSAFSSRAGAPSNTRWAPATTPEPEVEQQDDLSDAADEDDDDLDTLVDVGALKPRERAPAQVDQFSDPAESPEEFSMENIREQGMTGFMVKVATRLRTLQDPHERVRVRHRFYELIRQLKGDKTAQPPYNQSVAFKIRQLLEERGLAETLLLDFELLLNVLEEQAEKHRQDVEKRRRELEEEQRKKQEWDVVKEEDAEDEWEML